MFYSCKINNEYIFNLLGWSVEDFNSSNILNLETSDLITVKEVFNNVQLVQIYFGDNLIASYSQFNGYKSIEFRNNLYDNQREAFFDVLKVTLDQRDLISKVDELDKIVSGAVDIESMTSEEYKKYITRVYGERGQQEIFDGCEVELSNGESYQFTYNFEDQLNLLSALSTIMLAQDMTIEIPYHSHHQPCQMYAAVDLIRIYVGLQAHSIEVQTRVNMLNNWIRSLNDKEQMKQITYDSELASPYREKYLSVMASSASMIQSILERILPKPVVPTDEGEDIVVPYPEPEGEGEGEGSENEPADGSQTEPELDPVEGGPDE